MSDSFSAPVPPEAIKKLIVTMDAASARQREDLGQPIDSIVLHHLADELEGLAREIRDIEENCIDAYVTARQAGAI